LAEGKRAGKERNVQNPWSKEIGKEYNDSFQNGRSLVVSKGRVRRAFNVSRIKT
jgi:hypothetical protein